MINNLLPEDYFPIIDSLSIFTTEQRRTKNINSVLVPTYRVLEYIDTSTGWILSKDQVHGKYKIGEIPLGELLTKRQHILNNLRKEVREFAYFVLLFRNKRRGLTPGIKTVCRWYAEIKNMNNSDVYKHIPRLVKVGIISPDNNDVLMPLFQYSGSGTKASDHLSESLKASNVLDKYKRMNS